ncbi:MAG TPA: DEAD/DEAH box helicase [Firmicutes bacterium]|nr:DEAD/DEAH box helicase [Bacillota bacterium]
MNEQATDSALEGFHPAIRTWFCREFAAPSAPQRLGWPAIRAGEHVLILAATGTGKTLAAFLEILNRLYAADVGRGVQVVYVSPLKALNNDVARNLTKPLREIATLALELGDPVPDVKVAVRTGDTPQSARQAMLRKPPDILITTPESLYLMLTSSKARTILSAARTVIIDEIHALANNKRGTHLALSLERLEHLAQQPLQRIGLSATQRPLEVIADYLGGRRDDVPRPVRIIDARTARDTRIQVQLGPKSLIPPAGTGIWPDIYETVLEQVRRHRSTLIFVNARAWAERITRGINELAGEEIAKTHHGSLAREVREQVEEELKAGRLRALVCTSTLELGIDVGAIDLVIQITSPRSVAGALQRAGRSGHVLGAASSLLILAKSPDDLLDAAWVAHEMAGGMVEETHIPENCLDVLAQQIVSLVAAEDWEMEKLWRLVRQAYPYRHITRDQLLSVVGLLSGRYPARDYIELRPKLAWDRVGDVLRALPGTRSSAVAGVGTIPDRGYFPVYLAGQNVRLGELDEEFVYESRPGDAFLLGNSIWRIERMGDHRVVVSPAPGAIPKMPFWRAERGGRGMEAGRRVGAFWRALTQRLTQPDAHAWLMRQAHLDERAAAVLIDYLSEQQRHCGCVPHDRRLLLETYIDQAGDYRVILHSPYGYRVHSAWEMAARRQVRSEMGYELVSVSADNGIAWHIPRGQDVPPLESLVYLGSDIIELLIQELPSTALFGAYFRMAAARSLILGQSSLKKRVPLWLQRLKAGDLLNLVRKESEFPIALEALRECLHDVLDVPGLVALQQELATGGVQVEYHQSITPSPFARNFILQLTGSNMYEDDTPRAEKKAQLLNLDRELLLQMLGTDAVRQLLDADAVTATIERRQRIARGSRARNADELEETLLDLGDLTAEEILERTEDPEALNTLLTAGRAVEWRFPCVSDTGSSQFRVGSDDETKTQREPITSGEQTQLRYIAGEERSVYEAAYAVDGAGDAAQQKARLFLLKRYARTHGPFAVSAPAVRFGWPVTDVLPLLSFLAQEELVERGAFLPGGTTEEWCHRDVLQEINRRTKARLRSEVEAVDPPCFAAFLSDWQQVTQPRRFHNGPDALAEVLDQLAGLFLPSEVWERDVLPVRLPGYDAAWLDAICARGEFVWIMQGGGDVGKGKVAFLRREDVEQVLPLLLPTQDMTLSPAAQAVFRVLQDTGAAFATQIGKALPPDLRGTQQVLNGLWELASLGMVTNDTFTPVRKGKPPEDIPADAKPIGRHYLPGAQRARLRRTIQERVSASSVWGGGRWSLLRQAQSSEQASCEAEGLVRLAGLILGRYGLICRDLLAAEGLERLWPQLYRTLRVMEEVGEVRGGYFVTEMSGSQFAHLQAVDALRRTRDTATDRTDDESALLLLNSYDPSFIPAAHRRGDLPSGAVFTRSPLNYVVCRAGRPLLYINGYGRNLWTSEDATPAEIAKALALLPRLLDIPGQLRPRRRIAVAAYNGQPVAKGPLVHYLTQLGFQEQGECLVLWPSSRRKIN